MTSAVIAVLVAALLAALCVVLELPAVVGLVAVPLVVLAGVPTGLYGDRRGRP